MAGGMFDIHGVCYSRVHVCVRREGPSWVCCIHQPTNQSIQQITLNNPPPPLTHTHQHGDARLLILLPIPPCTAAAAEALDRDVALVPRRPLHAEDALVLL